MTQEEIQAKIDTMRFTYLGKEEEIVLKKILTELNTGGEGGGNWGEILGTLSDQLDLQAALDLLQSQINAIAAAGNKLFNYYNFI